MEQTMKKNKAMRAASVFLVLTLVSTCGFSGVLAKYVSADSGNDTARVAKYGVVTTVSGKLFGYSYAKEGETGSNQIQAVTSNSAESVTAGNASGSGTGDLLVAPGTVNNEGMTFKVKGNPEVSTKLTVEGAKSAEGKTYENTDIVLKKQGSGSYAIMVKEDAAKTKITEANREQFYTYSEGTFTQVTSPFPTSGYVYKISNKQAVDADYLPIAWKVNNSATPVYTVSAVESAVEAQLKKDAAEGDPKTMHKPNEAYPGTADEGGLATVKWEWPIGDSADVNAKDTLLGSMISTAALANNEGGFGSSDDFRVAVVNADGNSATEVKYAKINAASDSANEATVAYTGTLPTKWDDTSVVACLTVTYGESISVEQVD